MNYIKYDYTSSYRGIPVYTKPNDDDFDQILLPKSFVDYITELEEIKRKYEEKQLEEIFK